LDCLQPADDYFRKLKMPVYEMIIIDKAIDEKGLPFGSPFRT
jgi:hypothetical protein